jgi:hypothetical protein
MSIVYTCQQLRPLAIVHGYISRDLINEVLPKKNFATISKSVSDKKRVERQLPAEGLELA